MTLEKKGVEDKGRIEKRSEAAKRIEGKKLEIVWEV